MPRNMSFMLTTEQVRAGTKTVTRRAGWWFLNPGEIVNACVKCQGLRKGEKIEKIRQIRIVSTRSEPLFDIDDYPDNCAREGFPEMSTSEFVLMFMASHKGCQEDTVINRIEFEYVD